MKKNSSTKDLSLSANERLFFESISPFKPKKYKNLKPSGLKIYTFHAGFKKKTNDLLIIIFDEVATSSSVYSKTYTPSCPIIWDKKYNKGKVKALIVNSGNANAHTGKKGIKIIDEYVSYLCKTINCKKSQILVSSTGVIGELFDPKLIIRQINKIKKIECSDVFSAAKSIMTTDTFPKIAIKSIKINGITFKIYGIAKGSGMISPNMGTMLAYIFIDTHVPKNLLKKIMKGNLDYTFNSISVDSDTSTSDTLVLFSINKNKINFNLRKNFKILNLKVFEIMKNLSQQVVRDGEGLSKLIEVTINNSKTENKAKKIAFSIIDSPLVKTAIAGEDANWGRIIMAIGKCDERIDQNKIKIFFGKNLVCKSGLVNNKLNLRNLNKYMKNKIIKINVDLQNGNKKFTAYGNDLGHEYVRINADYRS